jgi:FHS family L-fucose permease-like MFS transporter
MTSKGSGLLVMAIVGGAVLPLLQGGLADSIGIHHAFFLPALCYVYILYYGFRGSRHKPTPVQLAERKPDELDVLPARNPIQIDPQTDD